MRNLKRKMHEHGITARELAAIADVSVFELNLKMRGILEWKLHEVLRICAYFLVVDVEELFYS